MFRRAADAPALKRAAAYQKALLDLDQLAGRFPHAQLGKAMEAHANVLDAVDAHKRHLFEYGHTKKAEKPLEAMEGLLSRETLGEGTAKARKKDVGCRMSFSLLTKRALIDEKVNEERRREVEEHDEATV